MPRTHVSTTRTVIARNLKALMERHNLNQPKLAKASGVSQTLISAILREQQDTTTEKLDRLAKPFGLRGWQLQVPDMPLDLLDSDMVSKIVRALSELTPEGRDYVAKTAEREAVFSRRGGTEPR